MFLVPFAPRPQQFRFVLRILDKVSRLNSIGCWRTNAELKTYFKLFVNQGLHAMTISNRIPDQIALRPGWKQNLCFLLLVAITVAASVLFFTDLTSTIHTYQTAATSQPQR